jgi:hypothetical protein
MICLTVSPLLELLALLLGELELDVELDPELEHPAAPSRAAATTVTPSQVVLRRL